MAAAPTITETVSISINDVELAVPKGELIVESVKRLGLEIPIFCYHSRMKPVGMCRMCLVEVGFKAPDGTIKKMPKPQAGCTLPASDGMAIYTDSEMIHQDRRSVLELLLINHPLDCPICDRGGECPLQNNTLFYGPSTSRFLELKRHLPKAYPLSKYVTLDLERCIQCGRCVRFTEEISGDSNLAFRFRGAEMQPSSFKLMEYESKFSGNVIEICPVGALTSSQYRFRARPWDLETKPAICTVCSNGCNIWLDYRVGRFVRINGRTNEAVNEEWTCDRGKFGHDWLNSEKRLTTPLIREGDSFKVCSWATAYDAILKAFALGGNQVAGLANGRASNESLYMMQKLFRVGFGSNNIDSRWSRHLPTYQQGFERVLNLNQVQTPIAALEDKATILVFGTSLADDEPIIFLRVRKAWFKNGARVIVAHNGPTDVDSFAHEVLRYRPGTGHIVASVLLNILVESGKVKVPPATRAALRAFTPEKIEDQTGVSESKVRNAAELLGEGPAIITTRTVLDMDQAQDILETLAGLAMTSGGEFNLYGLEANDQGARELGFLPDMLPGDVGLSDISGRGRFEEQLGVVMPNDPGFGTHGIIGACAEKTIQALWLLNADPLTDYFDRTLAENALENVDFLVYQGCIESEAMAFASVVLPMAAPPEQDGTYTNVERRVQRMKQIIPEAGNSKPAWRIFSEVYLRVTNTTPLFSAGEVFQEICRVNPIFGDIASEDFPDQGVLLGSEV